jgi:hypothetical protein
MLVQLFTDFLLRIRFVRWKGVNGWYSTGFGYVTLAEQVSFVLTRFRSRSSPSVKRNKRDETFVVFPAPFVAKTDVIL